MRQCRVCNRAFELSYRGWTLHVCSKRCARFYYCWSSMKQRCLNHNTVAYPNYGGRGITVCDDWTSFDRFREDMHYSFVEHCLRHGIDETMIERADNSLGYNKANCTWATRSQQQRNKRESRKQKGCHSKFKYVCWHKEKLCWMAYCYNGQKIITLGAFSTETRAALAALKAKIEVRRA